MSTAIDLTILDSHPQIARESIDDSIQSARHYRRFSDAGKHLIRLIHSIPDLYNNVSRDKIEIYIGRAGKSYNHVRSRWRSHHNGTKSHEGGLVAFTCSTSDVVGWEGACNKIVSRLTERGRLCIANILEAGGGQVPATEDSVIYITWKIISSKPIQVPTRNDITVILNQNSIVDYALQYNISTRALESALDPLSRPVLERTPIHWHYLHGA